MGYLIYKFVSLLEMIEWCYLLGNFYNYNIYVGLFFGKFLRFYFFY